MKTCKTCKWWKKHHYGYGHCDNILMTGVDSEWAMPGSTEMVASYSEDGPHGDSVVSRSDSISTGPNFGCIHHEEKEEE